MDNTWSKLRSTQVMLTRCWSNLDHHLGLVHNSWRCCNLQWRADQGDGLVRARTLALPRHQCPSTALAGTRSIQPALLSKRVLARRARVCQPDQIGGNVEMG